jgi:hypothetical protein
MDLRNKVCEENEMKMRCGENRAQHGEREGGALEADGNMAGIRSTRPLKFLS